MANHNTISNYLNEDIFQYKDNVNELMKKLLLLGKVDFELSTNGKMITEMIDHQEKPDEQTTTTIGSRSTTTHIYISNNRHVQ